MEAASQLGGHGWREEARGWGDSKVLNRRMATLPGIRNRAEGAQPEAEEDDELTGPVENHGESLAGSWDVALRICKQVWPGARDSGNVS